MYYEKIIPSPSHLFTSPIIFKLQRKKFGSIKKITNKNQQNRFINSEKKIKRFTLFYRCYNSKRKKLPKICGINKERLHIYTKTKKKSTEKKRNEF